MKQSKYFFLGMLVVMTSCQKNFLDVKDNSFLNRQTYVKDLSSMQDFMNGIYLMTAEGHESSSLLIYSELASDNLKPSSEYSSLMMQYNWQQTAGTTLQESVNSMNSDWKLLYRIIRACNFVIEDVDKYSAANSEKANNMKGQAYAIRALVHFRLVNVFAQTYVFSSDASHPGVPYITTSDITQPYTRQVVAEVYNELINDLKNAITLMPANVSDCRHMNVMAAKALLAKVYLYKADFANAKLLALEIVEKVPLLTISSGYPNDLFKNKTPNQTEVLFQATPLNGGFLGGLRGEYSEHFATKDIGDILQERGTDIRRMWVKDTLGTQLKVIKFPSGVAGGLVTYSPDYDYYSPILRVSEVYLIGAEAAAKTGDENTARTYLNAIRKRADPTVADVTASGQVLIDLIYKETRKEMCFEGSRMFDLQRWKLGIHRSDIFPGYQTDLPYSNEKGISPIPGPDVNLMGLKQNVGY